MDHLAIPVRDVKRSRRFYERYFGFGARTPRRYDDGVLMNYTAAGFALALGPTAAAIPRPAWMHFGVGLPDRDAVLALRERVVADGVELVEEFDEPEYVSFKCRDPDGYIVEASWEPAEPPGRMDAPAVLEVLDRLKGIGVWVDGGWGVDALLGEATREHRDLDLVVARDDLDAVRAALGYEPDEDALPGLPARCVLRAGERKVDLHLVVLDERGNGWQPLGQGAWGAYPADGLAGAGTIAGRRVRCLTPELQLRHHLGYPPGRSDRHDLGLLAERFRLTLPPGYGGR